MIAPYRSWVDASGGDDGGWGPGPREDHAHQAGPACSCDRNWAATAGRRQPASRGRRRGRGRTGGGACFALAPVHPQGFGANGGCSRTRGTGAVFVVRASRCSSTTQSSKRMARGKWQGPFGPVDPHDWRPLRDKPQKADVDLVVAGFGFVPNTVRRISQAVVTAMCRRLAAGCRSATHSWRPQCRECLLWETARESPGRWSRLRRVGLPASPPPISSGPSPPWKPRRRAGPLRRLRSLGGVRQILDEVFCVRSGLCDLATPQTLVCRCEEVALSEVQVALQQGAKDLQAVKLLTRLGMGPCQGRNRGPSAGLFLCQATGCTAEAVGRINPRPPVKPVTLGALAQMAEREKTVGGAS